MSRRTYIYDGMEKIRAWRDGDLGPNLVSTASHGTLGGRAPPLHIQSICQAQLMATISVCSQASGKIHDSVRHWTQLNTGSPERVLVWKTEGGRNTHEMALDVNRCFTFLGLSFLCPVGSFMNKFSCSSYYVLCIPTQQLHHE